MFNFEANSCLFSLLKVYKQTWQILSLHLQICPTQAPSTAPDTSKYVQFSLDELPQPVATVSKTRHVKNIYQKYQANQTGTAW